MLSKYKILLDLATEGIFFMDLEGRLVEFSQKSTELLGYTSQEMSKLTVYDWDKEITEDEFKDIIHLLHEGPITMERTHTKKDGSTYIAQIIARVLEIYNKQYIYASVRDITKQVEMQKQLANSEFRWKFAIEGNKDGLWDWNVTTSEVYFSPQWKKMLGFEENEIKASLDEWEKRVHPEDIKRVYKDIEDYFEGKTSYYDNEHRVMCNDGSYKWIRDRGIIVERDREGKPLRLIGTHSDNTELHNAMEQIKKQTYIDELTQLGNRKSYNQRISELIAQYQRYGITFSMLMFDIDRFKSINDNYGHQVGDNVLFTMSNMLKSAIRKNDYIFRIGGEEFIILLTDTNIDNAIVFAEKIRAMVEDELCVIKDKKITISIGVTETNKSDTENTIFKRADDNLYHAKESGRNMVASDI